MIFQKREKVESSVRGFLKYSKGSEPTDRLMTRVEENCINIWCGHKEGQIHTILRSGKPEIEIVEELMRL